jgi:hypothetical protein
MCHFHDKKDRCTNSWHFGAVDRIETKWARYSFDLKKLLHACLLSCCVVSSLLSETLVISLFVAIMEHVVQRRRCALLSPWWVQRCCWRAELFRSVLSSDLNGSSIVRRSGRCRDHRRRCVQSSRCEKLQSEPFRHVRSRAWFCLWWYLEFTGCGTAENWQWECFVQLITRASACKTMCLKPGLVSHGLWWLSAS